MLKTLKRWFGIDANPQTLERPAVPRGALPNERGETPPAVIKAAQRKHGNAADLPPRLSLERPPTDDGFDPYNTGAFNRSQSWERIGKKKR